MPYITDRAALLSLPQMQEAYKVEYRSYIPDPVITGQLKARISGKKIVIIIGAWCSDSRTQIPRFYKVADQAGLKDEQLRLIHVDESKILDKEIELQLNFTQIPVFICFNESGSECGRITESPETTIENDLLEIFNPKI